MLAKKIAINITFILNVTNYAKSGEIVMKNPHTKNLKILKKSIFK